MTGELHEIQCDGLLCCCREVITLLADPEDAEKWRHLRPHRFDS